MRDVGWVQVVCWDIVHTLMSSYMQWDEHVHLACRFFINLVSYKSLETDKKPIICQIHDFILYMQKNYYIHIGNNHDKIYFDKNIYIYIYIYIMPLLSHIQWHGQLLLCMDDHYIRHEWVYIMSGSVRYHINIYCFMIVLGQITNTQPLPEYIYIYTYIYTYVSMSTVLICI